VDFSFDEAQQAVADLAHRIMGDRLDQERLMAIEAEGRWFDADLWAELAAAGLTGIHLSEDVGGAGLDLVALAAVLHAQGTHVAPLPLLPTGIAALAVDTWGTGEQRNRLLPGVADGSRILTAAVQEPLDDRLTHPSTRFDGASVHGVKEVVEFARAASHAVLTVDGPTGPGLALVALDGPDITVEVGHSTRGDEAARITFDGAPAEALGGSPAWLIDHLRAAICATQLGVTEAALRLTAAYTSEREQFGRPIATFQAVTQRLADQFINVGGIRLATWSAAWRLSQGLDATEDLLVAKWWASERATHVAHATQHCHGGMGVARDYPLHRYTLWNIHLTSSLGAGNQTLRTLGGWLADA